VVAFAQRNILGSLQLIGTAHLVQVPRFVFISTCAVHEVILEDRCLDEAHPLWPTSHYGAHKAAIEKFVHSYGLGQGYGICALRPTGVYGLHHQPSRSKWYELIKAAEKGDFSGVSARGGKEVHAADVAKAVAILLRADGVAGQAFNCCDMYVSEQQIAEIVCRHTAREMPTDRTNKGPRHQIDTSRIRGLGMEFGGETLLQNTIEELLLI